MSSAPIVTLTLNPALDVSSSVEVVAPTHKLRCDPPTSESGGGGINVSRVCQRLGETTVAVAPLGGPNGAQVADLLHAEGIPLEAVASGSETRQSMTILEGSTGHQFRFVFPGPALTPEDAAACCDAVVAAAADSRVVVVSGSVPDGTDLGLFADLVSALPDASIIVDTSGPALVAALEAGVHLVKPSARELAAAVGRALPTEAEVESAARQLLSESGTQALIVSIGAGGAIAIDSDGSTTRLRAPTVDVKSAVGAGDSMVAGMAVGLHRGQTLRDAATLGVAAGTAAVLTEGTMLCRASDIDALHPLVVVDA